MRDFPRIILSGASTNTSWLIIKGHLHVFARLFVSSLLVCQNVHAHSHLCCLFPSACVCARVCVFVRLHCPLSGSFSLFNSSNGTSKEDFSEFDSLRSSSSVPTGTHPCLCLAVDTESVLFLSLSV